MAERYQSSGKKSTKKFEVMEARKWQCGCRYGWWRCGRNCNPRSNA